MTLEQLKLKWQKHNRDNGLSWNEVSLLVDDVVRVVMEKQRKETKDTIDRIECSNKEYFKRKYDV